MRGRKYSKQLKVHVKSKFHLQKKHKFKKRISASVYITVDQVVVLCSDQYLVEQDCVFWDSEGIIVVVDNCANSLIWNDQKDFTLYKSLDCVNKVATIGGSNHCPVGIETICALIQYLSVIKKKYLRIHTLKE